MTKEAPRSFAMVLQELDRGLVHAELSEQLVELVRAVEELGKSGSITLKLTLDPGKNARGEGSIEHGIAVNNMHRELGQKDNTIVGLRAEVEQLKAEIRKWRKDDMHDCYQDGVVP